MRILQLSTVDKTGGAALSGWYLHQAYRERGHKSWVAAGHRETSDPEVFQIPNDPARNLFARSLLHLSRRLNWLDARLASFRPSQVLAGMAEPMRALDILRGREDFHYPGSHRLLSVLPETPDIVNCNNLHGGYFDLRYLSRLSREVPVVLTLRDLWLLTGHCGHPIDCARWKTGCGECPDLSLYPAIRRDDTAYNWSRKKQIYAASKLHVIAPSRWVMDQVEQSMLAPAVLEKRVIHNSVDLSVFKPGERQAARAVLDLPSDAQILLFAGQYGRRNPYKDMPTMESSVACLADKREADNLLFVCLGEQAPNELCGRANICFAGYEEDRKRVALFYQAADVYLHAARAEVWGKTVTEALACGTPVVATAVGGIPEQIEDGVTGFLVPPRDAAAMASRAGQLLEDSDLARRMGAAAAEHARKNFGLDRQADSYLTFFREICEQRTQGD